MSDPLDLLKEKYPIFEFENRLHISQTIPLAENDTVSAMPYPARAKVRSEKFIQLPSTKTWKFIKPTMDDLRDVGLLTEVSPPVPTKKAKPAAPVSKPDAE